MPCRATLHVPHLGSSGDALFDLLLGATMQAQQVTKCYNNCLVTSIAVAKAAELLEYPGYKVTFGHLATGNEAAADVAVQIPHVWVTYEPKGLILDATLNDIMPTKEAFEMKAKLRYVPGRADRPMPNVGLPSEVPDQDKLEQYANNPDEYIAFLKAAPDSSLEARAYLFYSSLTQGLAGAKEDIKSLMASRQ